MRRDRYMFSVDSILRELKLLVPPVTRTMFLQKSLYRSLLDPLPTAMENWKGTALHGRPAYFQTLHVAPNTPLIGINLSKSGAETSHL